MGIPLNSFVDFREFDAHFGRDRHLRAARIAAFADVFILGWGWVGFDEDFIDGIGIFEDKALGSCGHGVCLE